MKFVISVLLPLLFLTAGCSHHLIGTGTADSMLKADGPSLAARAGVPTADIAATDALAPAGDVGAAEATDETEVSGAVADPLEPFNRAMFHVNDKLYFWVLKPVARGYRAVVPRVARTGVANFFYNLATPVRMANSILQGKGNRAGFEFSRFLINTTFGVLGFGNPAEKFPELNPPEEDLGQTLGSYGIGNGFFIIWPFLGPSTLRDSIGMFGDFYLHPLSYVKPLEAYIGIRGTQTINQTSLHIGEYEEFKKSAIAPYTALRNAYIQHRKAMVNK